MLFFGKSQCVGFVDARVFNLTGMIEGFESLRQLIPPNNIGHYTDRDFDIAYMNYIFSSDITFCTFFKIVHSLYIGQDVFIICDDSDWSENLIESILKLIQQRYGYDGYHVKSFDDYLYFRNNCQSAFNSQYGIYNLDMDKERYAMVSKKLAMVSQDPSAESRFM